MGLREFKGYAYGNWCTLRKRAKGKPKPLSVKRKAAIAEFHGLTAGCKVLSAGVEYVFGSVGGVNEGDKPWLWGYKTFKNGKLYAEPTRLDRWEKA